MSAFVSLRSSSCYWPSLNHLAKGLRYPMLSASQNVGSNRVPSISGDSNPVKVDSSNPFVLPGGMAVSLPSVSSINQPGFQLVEALDPNISSDLIAKAASIVGQPNMEVEVSAHEIPTGIRRDIESLFPNKTLPWPVVAVTIVQHTQNDMTTWSADVADERDILTAQLISTASSLCRELQADGYFADFIDPTSGRPFLSQDYTPATLFETDPIQRNFGVEIKDLGCCKAVAHAIWGTKVFIGTLFTNAPPNSPVMQRLLSSSA